MVRKIIVSAAAASLVTVSVAAGAADANRVSSSVENAEALAGSNDGPFYVMALLLAIGALVIITSNDGGDEPASP